MFWARDPWPPEVQFFRLNGELMSALRIGWRIAQWEPIQPLCVAVKRRQRAIDAWYGDGFRG